MSTRAERIENGIAWLDREGPDDWPWRIDLEVLDLGDSEVCVVGQTMGEFGQVMDDHGVPDIDCMIALGFEQQYSHNESFENLTAAWKTRIRQLRKERSCE